ncbi:MAG: flagellar protein FlgN, partial [Pseudomonadota bacterium]
MTYSAAKLKADIQTERAAIEALVAILDQEREALAQGHTDRLTHIAASKRELLLHVAHLGDQRSRVLEQSGMSADRSGMERWLQVHDQSGIAKPEWRALLIGTQQAEELNRRNGIYIDAGARANQQALQALLSACTAAGTYSAAGRAVNIPSSRSLASA